MLYITLRTGSRWRLDIRVGVTVIAAAEMQSGCQ
jgi:hypothetical protein